MATNVTVAGVSYAFPQTGDSTWGDVVTAWAIAVSSKMLQTSGGNFTLTAEADFGATWGLKSAYFKSRGTNPASTGVGRLANTEGIYWRNAANSANLGLTVGADDLLKFNGNTLLTTTGTLTANRAVKTDGTGALTSSSVTDTEQGYLSGVTSAIQTQLNAKQATGNYITALTGDVTASGPGSVAATIAALAVTTGKIADNAVTNAKAAQMSANTIKGNNTGGSANAADLTVAQVAAMFTAPTVQKFTSTGTTTGYVFTISTSSTCAVGDTYTNNGHTYTVLAALSAQSGQVLFCSGASAPAASGNLARATGAGTDPIAFTSATALATYTAPANVKYLKVRMVGGGGGGAAGGTSGVGSASAGTGSFFGANLLVANGGGAGTNSTASPGGTASLGSAFGVAFSGATAQGAQENLTLNASEVAGSCGAVTPFGGAGAGGVGGTPGAGGNAVANTGSGGGGAGAGLQASNSGGTGGSAGGFVDAIIVSPSATYVYAIGAGGSGATAGTNGAAGGAGAAGLIIVEEYYQ